MNILPLLLLLLALAAWLALTVGVGVYVYRDARRRGMNAPLWALVALLAPSLIGFAVYLVVRGGYADLECPACGAAVEESYALCPRCGCRLRAVCPGCAKPVEPDWIVCPRCAAPLQPGGQVRAPVRKRGGGLGKILTAVVLAALLLFGCVLWGLTRLSTPSGAISFEEKELDEYFQVQEGQAGAQVQAWLDGLELREDRAYALRYSRPLEEGGEFYYLVYAPFTGGQAGSSIGQGATLFATVITLQMERASGSGSVFLLRSTAGRTPQLRVLRGGQALDVELTEVEFNPTLYFLPGEGGVEGFRPFPAQTPGAEAMQDEEQDGKAEGGESQP